LSFGPRRAVKHADDAALRCDRPRESFHRFVTGAVAVLVDEVLPDPLEAQPGVELLGDRLTIDRGRESWPRAGERFGRIWV
jgi:hypothetical protein